MTRLGIGIGITRSRGRGKPAIITATTAPSLGPLTDGDQVQSGLSAGATELSNYQSTEGDITRVVARAIINGAAPVVLSDVSSFPPASLFASGEAGLYYDVSDLSSMNTEPDQSGSIPTVGQEVRFIADKSGNGNHATTASLSSSPKLGQAGTGEYYLDFDGVDDAMVTPTITPGTDKVQIFAGVRKLSDATSAVLAELSPVTDTNSGSFLFAAPAGSGAQSYNFRSAGDPPSNFGNVIPGAIAVAPTTNVVAGIGDIAGDSAILRVDGAQVAQSTANQGAGNYLAYPIYIGARNGASVYFTGHIYRLTIRFGPTLSADELGDMETYTSGNTPGSSL